MDKDEIPVLNGTNNADFPLGIAFEKVLKESRKALFLIRHTRTVLGIASSHIVFMNFLDFAIANATKVKIFSVI